MAKTIRRQTIANSRAVLQAIIDFWQDNAFGPSLPDIINATGLGRGTVQWHLARLREQGAILLEDNVSRSIRPVGMSITLPSVEQVLS